MPIFTGYKTGDMKSLFQSILNLFRSEEEAPISEERQMEIRRSNEKAKADRHELIVSNLINSLQTGVDKDRLYAIEELAEMKEERAIPALIKALVDLNKDVRWKAKDILPQISPGWATSSMAVDAVPFLINKLTSSDKDVWRTSARILGHLHEVSVPLLGEAIADGDDETQWKAIQIVAGIKTDISQVAPALVKAVDSDNVTIKEAALVALGATGIKDSAILEKLGANLEHSSSNIRYAAANSFFKFGAAAAPYSKLLVKTLLDSEHKVRTAAANALKSIGQPAVADLLELIQQRNVLRLLKEGRIQQSKGELFKGVDIEKFRLEPKKALRNVSWHFKDMLDELHRVDAAVLLAIKVLTESDIKSIGTMDTLITALKDKKTEIRNGALLAIGASGQEAEANLPELLQLFEKNHIQDYELVVQSLNKIKPNWADLDMATPFLNFLIERLGTDPASRINATLALKAMDENVVATLIRGLENKDRIIREEVIKLLALLGDNAKAAIPFLVEISKNDEFRSLREQADDVVKRIGFKKP